MKFLYFSVLLKENNYEKYYILGTLQEHKNSCLKEKDVTGAYIDLQFTMIVKFQNSFQPT